MKWQTKRAHYDFKLTSERVGDSFLRSYILSRRSPDKEVQLMEWLKEGKLCQTWLDLQLKSNPKLAKSIQLELNLKRNQIIKSIEASELFQGHIVEIEDQKSESKGLLPLIIAEGVGEDDWQLDTLLIAYEKEDMKDEINQLTTEKDDLQKKLISKEKIIETMKKDYLKAVNDLESLKKENKETLKNMELSNQDRLTENSDRLKSEVSALTKQLETLKEETKPKAHYESLQNNYLILNDKNKQLLSENKQLKVQVEKQSQMLSTYFGQENNSQLKAMNHSEAIVERAEDVNHESLSHVKSVENLVIVPKVKLGMNQRIGYCLVKSAGHILCLADKLEIPILNIPDSTLVGENQFVQVDEKGHFIKDYMQMFEAGVNDYQIKEFVEKEGQIVGITSSGKIYRSYKTIQFHKDLFLKSAIIRNQKAYLVQKTIGNVAGAIATDITSDQECFIPLTDTMKKEGQNFYSDTIVFIKEECIVNKLLGYKFYTTAPSYKGSELGVATYKEGNFFFERLNGERVRIVLDLDDVEIGEGDIVSIDSYNHLIGKKKSQENNNKTIEQRMRDHSKEAESSVKDSCIVEENQLASLSHSLDLKFLIVGDKSQQLKYKLAFKQVGYDTEVISAFDQWKKIDMEARKVDFIIFASDCASHTNYHMLKKHHHEKLKMSNRSGVNNLLQIANTVVSSLAVAI